MSFELTDEKLADYRLRNFCADVVSNAASRCREHRIKSPEIYMEYLCDPLEARAFEDAHGACHVYEHDNKKYGLVVRNESGVPERNLMARVLTISVTEPGSSDSEG